MIEQQQLTADQLAILSLTEEEQSTLNAYLDVAPRDQLAGAQAQELLYLKTLTFGNGHQADFRIVRDRHTRIELRLHDDDGLLVAHTDFPDRQLHHGQTLMQVSSNVRYTVLLHIPSFAGFACMGEEEQLLAKIGMGGLARA